MRVQSKRVIGAVAGAASLRRLTPRWLRNVARKMVALDAYTARVRELQNPYHGTPDEWAYNGSSERTLGIIYDPLQYHMYHQYACHDLDVSYRVVDIRADDWIDRVRAADVAAWIVWPTLYTVVLKEMFDERLKLMAEQMDQLLYPSADEIWLLDNKRRVRDWLTVAGFPTPETRCMFDFEEAMHFAATTDYPIVFKSLHGAISTGVVICERRVEAERLIKLCFSSGFVPRRSDPRNRQWNCVVFQEYLPDVEEHRVIRVADSYVYLEKVRRGQFHSGSGSMLWGGLRRDLFDLARRVTDYGGHRSMDVDFFVASDGRILVNELHAVFGGPVIPDSPEKGRYLYDEAADEWHFEAGNFYRNYCANLRVQTLLEQLGETRARRLYGWEQEKQFFTYMQPV